jgi:TPR repeat protein
MSHSFIGHSGKDDPYASALEAWLQGEGFTEPARRNGVTVEPALIDALMNDAPKEDPLPLLAFALQRLWLQYVGVGALTFTQYDNMGRLTGMIVDAAERALRGMEPGQDTPPQKSLLAPSLNALGAETFVPALADLNEKGALIRKPAAWESFSRKEQELLARFDRWRLVKRRGEDGGTVEVAHEALFSKWPRLQEWLDAERALLEALRGVKSAAGVWERQERRTDYLVHRGERLTDTRALLGHPAFARELDARDRAYIGACATAERTRLRRDFAFRWGLRALAAGLAAVAMAAVMLSQNAADETVRAGRSAAEARAQRDQISDILGTMRQHGGAIQLSSIQSLDLLKKQAAEEQPYAMRLLGAFYYLGTFGVPQDFAKARQWYEKAAEKGEAAAMSNLGRLYRDGQGALQDLAKAREWYKRAAEKGEATAMTALGHLYEDGQGVPQDFAKAREWYEKAAEKGEATAMTALGDLYEDGQGVPQDFARAREWYEKAAEKGEVTAMTALGRLYEDGQSVPQDLVKAREWYQKAVKLGAAQAVKNFATLQVQIAFEMGNFAKAAAFFKAQADAVEAAETAQKGKAGSEAGSALGAFAYYLLFARQFDAALAATERALSLAPYRVWIATNQAHALMFLGRAEEARAAYRQHKGERIPEHNKTWEQEVADDFAEFEKRGLTHPQMVEIRKLLALPTQ